jgi:hypothetical protein
MTTVMKVRKIKRSTLVLFSPGSGDLEPDVPTGARIAGWTSR